MWFSSVGGLNNSLGNFPPGSAAGVLNQHTQVILIQVASTLRTASVGLGAITSASARPPPSTCCKSSLWKGCDEPIRPEEQQTQETWRGAALTRGQDPMSSSVKPALTPPSTSAHRSAGPSRKALMRGPGLMPQGVGGLQTPEQTDVPSGRTGRGAAPSQPCRLLLGSSTAQGC